jgi:hypothetical protein
MTFSHWLRWDWHCGKQNGHNRQLGSVQVYRTERCRLNLVSVMYSDVVETR